MKLSFLFFKKLYANITIITVINPATAYTTRKYNMTVTKFKYHGIYHTIITSSFQNAIYLCFSYQISYFK